MARVGPQRDRINKINKCLLSFGAGYFFQFANQKYKVKDIQK